MSAKRNNRPPGAMAKLNDKYPDDLDVMALYAESLMTLNPWAMWTREAEGTDIVAADNNTLVVKAILERVRKSLTRTVFGACQMISHYFSSVPKMPPACLDYINLPIGLVDPILVPPSSNSYTLYEFVFRQAMELPGGMEHAAILHLYCHLMELSHDPMAAMPAADVLRTLLPHASHLVHMASHIDIWGGHYKVTGVVGHRNERGGPNPGACPEYVSLRPLYCRTFPYTSTTPGTPTGMLKPSEGILADMCADHPVPSQSSILTLDFGLNPGAGRVGRERRRDPSGRGDLGIYRVSHAFRRNIPL